MTMRTMRDGCIFCGAGYASHDVFSKGYWFKVSGVYTATDTAKVIEGQTYWNPAYEEFIGYAMGNHIGSSAARCRSNRDESVATAYGASPVPARLGFVYARPKIARDFSEIASVEDGTLREHRKISPFGVTERGASTSPLPLFYHGSNN